MRTLALDPGNKTGWAVACQITGELEAQGTLKLWPWTVGKEGPHKRLARWSLWLFAMITFWDISLVAYEKPIKQNKAFSGQDLAKQLEAVLMLTCNTHGVPYVSVSVTKVKAFAAGSGKAGKEDTMAAARRLWGYVGDSEDAADALCVLHWVANTQDQGKLKAELRMDSPDSRIEEVLGGLDLKLPLV